MKCIVLVWLWWTFVQFVFKIAGKCVICMAYYNGCSIRKLLTASNHCTALKFENETELNGFFSLWKQTYNFRSINTRLPFFFFILVHFFSSTFLDLFSAIFEWKLPNMIFRWKSIIFYECANWTHDCLNAKRISGRNLSSQRVRRKKKK